MSEDWLVGGNRSDRAHERLIALAADLIARRGVDRFDLNELAQVANCSRATIYRHAGGKKQLVEAVLAGSSAGIVDSIRTAVTGTRGRERVAIAIEVALREIRADRVTAQFLCSRRVLGHGKMITRSPTVIGIAADLTGLAPTDTTTAALVVRSVLALLLWPATDPDEEERLVAILAGTVVHETPR